MDVDPDRLQPGQPARAALASRSWATATGTPNLASSWPVWMLTWVSTSTSGLTRTANRAGRSSRACLEGVELVGRLHVDGDAVADGQGQLLLGLADAGEDGQRGVAAGPQHPDQLPPLTTSKPAPSPARVASTARLALALTAYRTRPPMGSKAAATRR